MEKKLETIHCFWFKRPVFGGKKHLCTGYLGSADPVYSMNL
jgi:hypothetical protein